MITEGQVDAGTTRLYAIAPDMLTALERISEKAESWVRPERFREVSVTRILETRLDDIGSIVSRILSQVRKGA